LSGYCSWNLSIACWPSISFAGSHVIWSYPVHRTRYCYWLHYTQECSTRSTCYSWSPSTSTDRGGGICCPTRESSETGSNKDTCCILWICILNGKFNSYAYGDICGTTSYGPNLFQSSFRDGRVVLICLASNHTLGPTCIFGLGILERFAPYSIIAWLCFIGTRRWSWICCIVFCTISASTSGWSLGISSCPSNVILRSIPLTAKNWVHFVISDVQLFVANSGSNDHLTQSSCWCSMRTRKYCSILAFIRSVCASVWGWNAVDYLRSILNRLQGRFQNTAANWGPLSNTIVFGSPCSLNTSFRNISASSPASTVIRHATKCRIFDNLSTTTQMASYPSHSGSPVTKSMDRSFHSISSTERGRNPTKLGGSVPREHWQSWQFQT